jgi:glycolate oxidase FAD binding subunit
MMADDVVLETFAERIRAAAAAKTALRIRGGGTKDFYGNTPRGDILDTRVWSGIESYEPSELVITARCGTPLSLIEATLAENNQMLAFEPPHFGVHTTLGGCIAAGLAGPRRMAAGYSSGGVRDFVLGARLLDGNARLLRFGGTVIKNVAGYDVSRLLAGSMGILGVIVDVSVKVLPRPRSEQTLSFEMDERSALQSLNEWAGQPLPVSASLWRAGQLQVRLSGSDAVVREAKRGLGGEQVEPAIGAAFWQDLREHKEPWFQSDQPLWRISLPTTAEPLQLGAAQCMEWGGAQRWLHCALPASDIRARAGHLGGHATLFRGGERKESFAPLSPALATIHQRLKAEFDPAGVLNPGRLYEGL